MFVSSFKKMSENGNSDAHRFTRSARLLEAFCFCFYDLHTLTFCILFTPLYSLSDIGVSNWKLCCSAVVEGCHHSALGQCSLQSEIGLISVPGREIPTVQMFHKDIARGIHLQKPMDIKLASLLLIQFSCVW